VTPRAVDLVVTAAGARYRGQVFPCSVGRGGIGVKRGEGDGITPLGRWRIGELRYRADRMAPPITGLPVAPIGPADIWSDDPTDPAYNLERTARDYPFSHERMFRADPLYDLVAITDFNWPEAVPGAGSAIFLHAWRKPRHPTAGCVAFAPPVLRFILESWVPEARLVVR
jgi:L,D-peptidoglycan transpeptidase YkuD (ErfK/YbiS/YcfS/YnhG family)